MSPPGRNLWIAAFAVVLASAIFFAIQSAGPEISRPPTSISDDQQGESNSLPALTPIRNGDEEHPVSSSPSVNQTAFVDLPVATPAEISRQKVLETIQQASISYDPAELPRIQPYLLDGDAEIRESALNGVVALGHSAGAPLLRDAATRIADPTEAANLRKMADWLELPSASVSSLKLRYLRRASPSGPQVPSAKTSPSAQKAQ